MSAPLRKFYTWGWWWCSIHVSFWAAGILAKTNTPKSILSEDIPDLSSRGRSRSLKCVPSIKHFEVQLTEALEPGEGVGLVGDHAKLGEWQIDKSLEMKRRRRNPSKWYLKILMCSTLRIYYRFFIYYKDTRGRKRISHWEGQQHARILEAYEMFYNKGSIKFGHAHELAVGGGVQQERGWLREEYILQFKFIWPQHIRFTKFSHFIRKPEYVLKLKAYPHGNGHLGYIRSELERDIVLEVTCFVDFKSKLKALNGQGVPYKIGDIVIFHVTTADFIENWHVLGIYTRQEEFLGEVVIPPNQIKRSEDILELPIFDERENNRVGWLTLPFLRIKALPQALKLNMRASFHHYWPLNWPTMDIGHRGLGNSFYHHSSEAVQNTIESFLKAKEVNSDMIHLDVHLTKDYVPIVWHGFGFFTSTSRPDKELKISDLWYVHLHDLTYQELLNKRVFVIFGGLLVEMTHLNTVFVPNKKRIFPQLAMVYQELTATFGIVLNIKWPQLLSGGSLESLLSLDKNRYVDEIIETTTEFGCGRPIIMASFDADICTMLRFKQHMFPIVFLSLGQDSLRESYADLRTHSLSNAIQFVQASDILGAAIYAKEIIPPNDNNLLNLAFQLHQPVFVWGSEDMNDISTLDYFRDEQIAGIIYDRIESRVSQNTKTKRKRFGFFEAQELQHIFLRQCIAAGNLTISEGLPDTHSPFWPRFRSLDEF